MTQYLKGTLLAFVSVAFAGIAMADDPQPQNESQGAEQTSPSAASSPHQRQGTQEEQVPEANPTADTEPAASSTRHQRQATGMQTEKTQAEKDQMMKDCIEQAQARDSSMTMDQAKTSCKDQMKSTTTRTGGG